MPIKVTLMGRARLERQIQALPKALRDLLKADMEKYAQQFVDKLKTVVPVDTGELRDSIGWTWGCAPKKSTALATAKSSLGSGLTITIYAGNESTLVKSAKGRRPYLQKAWIVEFGTSKMPARPYFRPLWKLERRKIRSKMKRAATRAIKKVANS